MSNPSSVSLGGETVKATVAKVVMALSGFIGTILFARILGPTAFGGFYLLFGLVKLADRPLSGWAVAGKKRFSEATSSKREIVGAQILFNGIWIIVVVFATIWLSPWLQRYTGLYMAPFLFAILLISESLYEPFERLVQARGLIGVATWTDALRSYLTLPLQLVLVFLGFGAAGMAYGLVGGTLLTVPVILYYLRTIPIVPTVGTIRSLWKYGQYSVPTSYFTTIYNRFDILLLGFLLTPAAAAHYEVAFKMTMPAMFVAAAAGSGLMARVSNHKSRGKDIAQDISNTLSFSSFLSIPIFFGALAIPQQLVVTLYGDEYAKAALLLVGISLYRVFRTQSAPLLQTANGLDMPDANMRLSGVALMINIISGILLTIWYGSIGVVIATILAEILIYVSIAYTVKQTVPGVTLFPRTLLEQLSAGILMFATVSGIHQKFAVNSWIDLSVLLIIGACVYSSTLLAVSNQLRLTIGSVLRGSRIEHLIPKQILNW